MADGIVQVAPDSTGKRVDTSELTVNAQTVERQRVVLADPTSPTGLAPVTVANGILADVSRVQGAVTIFNGTVDSGNSSTTPLAANGVFTGAWIDCFNQGSVLVYLFSNVSSAANGLSLQWSNDGVNADETYAETFTAGSRALVMQVTQRGRYFRLVYTNGAALQASFRLNVIHILNLIDQDAKQAQQASEQSLAARRQANRMRVVTKLGRLSSLGGPRAARVIQDLTEDLSANSGFFKACRPGGL